MKKSTLEVVVPGMKASSPEACGDFGKALVPKVCVDGVWHSVEYEGLPLMLWKVWPS